MLFPSASPFSVLLSVLPFASPCPFCYGKQGILYFYPCYRNRRRISTQRIAS